MVTYCFQIIFSLVVLSKCIHSDVDQGQPNLTTMVPCADTAVCTDTEDSGTTLITEQMVTPDGPSLMTTSSSPLFQQGNVNSSNSSPIFTEGNFSHIPFSRQMTISTPSVLGSDYQYYDDWVLVDSTDVNMYLNQQEALEYIASFADEVQRTLITETLRYCPYVKMCNFTFGLNPPPFSLNNTSPCCFWCSCDPDCVYNVTCCPDYRALPLIPMKSVYGTCMEMYIRHPSANVTLNDYSYMNVYQNCLPNTDESLNFRCTEKFNLFPDISIADVCPVSNNVTMKTYRNRYCALCNGENPAHLIQWDMQLQCKGQPSFDNTNHLISGIIAGSNQCVLKLFKPDSVDVEYCTYVHNSCNETGLWLEFDHEVERACGMYENEIGVAIAKYTQYFKNPFCAICNGFDPQENMCIHSSYYDFGDPYNFAGLLRLDIPSKTESPTNADCGSDSMYDIVTNRCLEVTCPFYSTFQNGKCEPIITTSIFGCKMFYLILPPVDISLVDMYVIIPTLRSTLKNYIYSVCPYSFCSSQTMIVLQENAVEEIETAFIDRIEIMYEIESSRYCDLTIVELVENLLSLDNLNITLNDNLSSSDGPNWFVARLKDDSRGHDVRIPHDRYTNWTLYGTPVPLSDMIAESFEENGRRVIPYFLWGEYPASCLYSFRLLTLRQCPMFSVNKEEFDLVETPYGLKLHWSNETVEGLSDFVYDDQVVGMCVDTYTRLFKNTATHVGSDDILHTVELVVSVVSVSVSVGCLVITLVTYSCLPELRLLPGKNNMALIVSLLLAQTAYLLGSYYGGFDSGSFSCRLVGGLTHFFWLLSIFWMNVCTFHMFLVLAWRDFVSDFASTRKYLQYHAYCILLSTLLVAVNVVVSLVTSDYTDYGYGESSCYISSQRMIEVTFGLPAAFVVIANISMFIIIVVKLKRASAINANVKRERNYFVVFVKLSTITGATWLFGFVYMWTGIVAFSFIFTLLNGSQGLFIMLSFVCNTRTMSKLKDKSKLFTSSQT